MINQVGEPLTAPKKLTADKQSPAEGEEFAQVT